MRSTFSNPGARRKTLNGERGPWKEQRKQNKNKKGCRKEMIFHKMKYSFFIARVYKHVFVECDLNDSLFDISFRNLWFFYVFVFSFFLDFTYFH